MTGSWWVQRIYDEGGFVLLFTWVIWVLGSIVLHELSHGWAALWEGDDTPRRLHRLTINPWVHMGPTSLIVFAVLGIAWGLMPVDPSRFRGTCYRAAGWACLGTTSGRGLARPGQAYRSTPRLIFVNPLAADFRRGLGVIASNSAEAP